MDWLPGADDASARLLVQRGLGVVYLVAFLAARRQYAGLLGRRGLTPMVDYVARMPFRKAPSLFQWWPHDRVFIAVTWVGTVLGTIVVLGLVDATPPAITMAVWFALWVLYLSIVNVGQIWYSFGWEILLLETGFLAIFLGPAEQELPAAVLVLFWWLLFRLEFGAGLIKLRGDRCWRDLTCLDYHHETQPMPNAFSWYFHRLPRPLHRLETLANHVAQLIMPFVLFGPPPFRTAAAVAIVVTQTWLVISGNFAWLNAMAIVIAFAALDGGIIESLTGLESSSPLDPSPVWFDVLVAALVVAVIVLSIAPARNLLSRSQKMNASFGSLRLVNTYGAFGTVTRRRDEIVLEGTADPHPGPSSEWLPYEFKGKPGDPGRRPRQYAPYHLRLDWLMWFIPFSDRHARPWFETFLRRVLANEPEVMALLRHNPFPDAPPVAVRARRFRYRFTSWSERRATGAWWHRELVGPYARAVSRSRRADPPTGS